MSDGMISPAFVYAGVAGADDAFGGGAGRLVLTGGTDVTTAPPGPGLTARSSGAVPPVCKAVPGAGVPGASPPVTAETATPPCWNAPTRLTSAICSAAGRAAPCRRPSRVSRRTRPLSRVYAANGFRRTLNSDVSTRKDVLYAAIAAESFPRISCC
jgi:hypothetical protein